MNLKKTNELLEVLVEGMLDVDVNDLDSFGMDAATQKRLRVKRLHKPKNSKQIRKPTSTHLPYQWT